MDEDAQTPLDSPRLEQAALWFQKLSEESVADEGLRAFEEWRDADARNAAAFAEIGNVYKFARATADHPESLALRHETLARLVIGEPPRQRNMALLGLVGGIFATLAALLLFLLAGPASLPDYADAPVAARTYKTGVGQRLAVTLADGTHVTLNTNSRLHVFYTDQERRVVLEDGQAFFNVARQQARPFRVLAGSRLVTAKGTAFDVRLDDKSLKVALLEGVVIVSDATDASGQKATLQPNDVLVASDAGMRIAKDLRLSRHTSWTEGLVIFENDSLDQAVSEMNRYAEQEIILTDPLLKTQRISGVFRTGETETFVEALELMLPITTAQKNETRITLARRK